MSMPHTGKLTARIHGEDYQFNGDVWTGPDAALVATLNELADAEPKTHITIDQLAKKIFRRANIQGGVISFEVHQWSDDLPDGAID
jgi:hypothetical protein